MWVSHLTWEWGWMEVVLHMCVLFWKASTDMLHIWLNLISHATYLEISWIRRVTWLDRKDVSHIHRKGISQIYWHAFHWKTSKNMYCLNPIKHAKCFEISSIRHVYGWFTLLIQYVTCYLGVRFVLCFEICLKSMSCVWMIHMSHIGHVAFMIESPNTYKWVPHVWRSPVTHVRMSHVTCVHESCHTCTKKSCHVYEWVV